MKRWHRVVVEVLAPSTLGALVIGLPTLISRHDFKAFSDISLLLLFGYLYAGLPSIAYALVLEVAFACGLRPVSWTAVALSSFLGLAAGTVIVAGIGARNFSIEGILVMGGVGLIVGAAIGLFIKHRSTRAPAEAV
jgi:hypothetical protein